eukprot:scaffold35523_cov53-Phaeocystis_antarctica.AAC.5
MALQLARVHRRRRRRRRGRRVLCGRVFLADLRLGGGARGLLAPHAPRAPGERRIGRLLRERAAAIRADLIRRPARHAAAVCSQPARALPERRRAAALPALDRAALGR